jgi:hypothetical protein
MTGAASSGYAGKKLAAAAPGEPSPDVRWVGIRSEISEDPDQNEPA